MNIGIPRHLNWYWVHTWLPNGQAGAASNNNSPNFLQMIDIVNVNDVKGTPLINYSYDYQEGYLKFPESGSNHYKGGIPGLAGGLFSSQSSSRRYLPDGNPAASVQIYDSQSYLNVQPTAGPPFIPDYDSRIEKSAYFRGQRFNAQDPTAVPHINIACMPVQSNAPLSATPTFASAVIQWEVSCEIDIEQCYDYMLPQGAIPWPMSLDYITSLGPTIVPNYTAAYGFAQYIVGKLVVPGLDARLYPGPPGAPRLITNSVSNPVAPTGNLSESGRNSGESENQEERAMDQGETAGGHPTTTTTTQRPTTLRTTSTTKEKAGRGPFDQFNVPQTIPLGRR